jgi:hypothetical protein
MLFTILFSMLVTALALMLAFPKTPTARAIHRALVEAPAEFLLDLTWARVGQLALSGAALVLMMLMGPQMLMLMATMGLDAAFLEILILMWLASVSGSLAAAWRSVRRTAARALRVARRPLSPRRRSRAPGRRRKPRPQGRKDDADGPGWAFA